MLGELFELAAEVVVFAPPRGKARAWKLWAILGLAIVTAVVIGVTMAK